MELTTKDIENLKEAVKTEAGQKKDHANEEDAIYAMSESAGWEIMMRKANRLIVELLEPIDASDVSDSANLALIGANTLANAKAIKVLREFVSQAESVKAARRLDQAKQQGESKR